MVEEKRELLGNWDATNFIGQVFFDQETLIHNVKKTFKGNFILVDLEYECVCGKKDCSGRGIRKFMYSNMREADKMIKNN